MWDRPYSPMGLLLFFFFFQDRCSTQCGIGRTPLWAFFFFSSFSRTGAPHNVGSAVLPYGPSSFFLLFPGQVLHTMRDRPYSPVGLLLFFFFFQDRCSTQCGIGRTPQWAFFFFSSFSRTGAPHNAGSAVLPSGPSSFFLLFPGQVLHTMRDRPYS